MATDKEMKRGLKFSQKRADGYREIAAKGGEGRMSAAAAEAEAARFQRFADRIAARIEERNS